MYRLLLFAFLASVFIGEALASPRPCLYTNLFNNTEWDLDISLDEMVRRSEGIALAEAAEFRLEDRDDGLDGVYIFNVLLEMKSYYPRGIEIPGMRPYESLPQSYIDTTLGHQSVDLDRVRIGGTSVVELEGQCVLAPRFLIGYRYLLFIGLKSHSAFEPIHSPNLDAWYLAVEREVATQYRETPAEFRRQY